MNEKPRYNPTAAGITCVVAFVVLALVGISVLVAPVTLLAWIWPEGGIYVGMSNDMVVGMLIGLLLGLILSR